MELHDVIIIINLIILEGLLSVDNAAVLAGMVQDLPPKDRKKALNWGIWGAYLLRGVCLLFASILISVFWLKIVGGAYLIWLAYKGLFSEDHEEQIDGKNNFFYKLAGRIGMSQLWATIVLVEVMDLVFSMDNVFAAVALSPKFWVVCTGVFIGILVMRLVAFKFVNIMDKYPEVIKTAFVVILILGLKLVLDGTAHYVDWLSPVENVMKSHWFDLVFSAGLMIIFFFPVFLAWRKKRTS